MSPEIHFIRTSLLGIFWGLKHFCFTFMQTKGQLTELFKTIINTEWELRYCGASHAANVTELWCLNDDHKTNKQTNKQKLAKYKWDLMVLLPSSRVNFCSVSLDLQLIIKDISELPKCAKMRLLERRGGGLRCFTARNEQWAMSAQWYV